MKLLITGVNGFVGPHLAAHLATRQPAAELWGQAWGSAGRDRLEQLAPTVRVVDADLSDRCSLDALFDEVQPEMVFHLAAASSVAGSWSDPTAIFRINAVGQMHLFDAMLARQLRPVTVVASSAEVYGNQGERRLAEDAPLAPISPYGVSKAAQDLIAAQYHLAHDLPTVRLRLFNHTGPGQSSTFAASSFARQIAAIERGDGPPYLRVGNLDAVRDFSDVADVVEGYWLAASRGRAGAAYNVCSGAPVSIGHLLDVLLDLTEVEIEVRADPERMRASDVPYLVGDPRSFAADTGYRTTHSLRETLGRLLDWWRTAA